MPSLPIMPRRIARLKQSDRGYPVPWFVQWFNEDGQPCPTGEGKPDFRVVGPDRIAKAYRFDRCWICGQTIVNSAKVFVIGPMCVVNRVTSEPPSHRDCAEFAVRACPFMLNPREKRSLKNMPEGTAQPAGIHLDRNPGAMTLYQTGSYKPFRAGDGVLFRLGRPIKVDWYSQGRRATRAEIEESVNSGLPHLMRLANEDGPEAVEALHAAHRAAVELYPPEEIAA
jgi:ferredoxin